MYSTYAVPVLYPTAPELLQDRKQGDSYTIPQHGSDSCGASKRLCPTPSPPLYCPHCNLGLPSRLSRGKRGRNACGLCQSTSRATTQNVRAMTWKSGLVPCGTADKFTSKKGNAVFLAWPQLLPLPLRGILMAITSMYSSLEWRKVLAFEGSADSG